MFRKSLLGTLFTLLLLPAAMAQTSTLTGTVEDERTGERLPGVNIYLQELQRGTATTVDGDFRIENVPYGTYQLRVSFIGYRTRTLPLEVRSATESFQITLAEDLVGLDELVITGQGSGVIRHRLSTNVSTISAKQMRQLPAVQLDQILQANIANSQVRLTSGQPGTASLIRGRGVVSALTATTPVIYVDGVRVDNTTSFSL